MQFQTRLYAPQDGKGSYGVVEVRERDGTWRRLDQTKVYREYPSMVRARTAAESLVRKWAKKLNPDMIFTLTRD